MIAKNYLETDASREQANDKQKKLVEAEQPSTEEVMGLDVTAENKAVKGEAVKVSQ